MRFSSVFLSLPLIHAVQIQAATYYTSVPAISLASSSPCESNTLVAKIASCNPCTTTSSVVLANVPINIASISIYTEPVPVTIYRLTDIAGTPSGYETYLPPYGYGEPSISAEVSSPSVYGGHNAPSIYNTPALPSTSISISSTTTETTTMTDTVIETITRSHSYASVPVTPASILLHTTSAIPPPVVPAINTTMVIPAVPAPTTMTSMPSGNPSTTTTVPSMYGSVNVTVPRIQTANVATPVMFSLTGLIGTVLLSLGLALW